MKSLQAPCLLAAALALLSPSAYSKGDAARLMLKVPDGSPAVEVVKMSEGAVDLTKTTITVDQAVTAQEWTTLSVTLKSPSEVDVLLRLSATWTKEDTAWVYIDNVKFEGGDLLNPDLEEGNPGKAPSDWKFMKTGANSAEYIQDAALAASGAGVVELPYSCPLTQTIHLPKDKEVTISFSAKLAPGPGGAPAAPAKDQTSIKETEFVVPADQMPAQGADYPTKGGAGGQVVTVTSLVDGGPGSLREALNLKGPRIIHFAVGGEIFLKDSLQINEPFVTVEGESAPSPGISLMGDRLRVRSHDVILRHIRVRVGALLTASDPQNRDGIQIDGAQDGSDPNYRVLVDHCSVSWAIDENVQVWGKNNHDIVVRDSILAEGLANSIHPKGGTHSAGLVVGPGIKNVLIQGNLFASNAFRNPVGSAGSSIVVVNNFISNPGFAAIHFYAREGDVTAKADVIGNVVVAGKSTKPTLSIFHKTGLNLGSKLYFKDNISQGTEAFNLASRPVNWAAGGPSPFVETPAVPVPDMVQILPSDQVEASVLAKAGARPDDRDEVDKRLIEEARTRSGSIKDFPTDPRLCPQKPVALTGAVGGYATLLQKYVTPKGTRYAAWKNNAEDVALLQKEVDDIAASKDQDLAFLLNAYNAWMLHEVIKAYPVKSVKDLGPQFLEEKRLKVAGSEMSFAELENTIDSRFHDLRTNFALNRASRGGPIPIAEPFVAETLTTQLDVLTGKFINSNQVEVKGQEIAVSALFDWKKEQLPRGAEGTINTYRNSHVPLHAKVTYQPYDWALNEAP